MYSKIIFSVYIFFFDLSSVFSMDFSLVETLHAYQYHLNISHFRSIKIRVSHFVYRSFNFFIVYLFQSKIILGGS